MEENGHPIGKSVLTILGLAGAVTLRDVNLWLAAVSAVVSIVVGVLTICVLVQKLKK